MYKKEIRPIGAPSEVWVGLGAQFPGIGGYWSGEEMKRNARKGIPGVPCAEWDKKEYRYRYYILEG